MKKLITSIIAASLLMAICTSCAHAQVASLNTPDGKAAFDPAAPGSTVSPASPSAKSKKELKKEARSRKEFGRISRRFDSRFDNATNVSWTPQPDGFVASFDSDGLRHRVWYNHLAEVTYLMITYNEESLPSSIKRQVNSAYRDYGITCVNEIQKDDIVVYLVTLENNQNIKQITVCDGDINLYKQFRKAL